MSFSAINSPYNPVGPSYYQWVLPVLLLLLIISNFESKLFKSLMNANIWKSLN